VAVYCFICPKCGSESQRGALPESWEELLCGPCLGPTLDGPQIALKRDYRAENVGVAVAQLKREREHSKEEYAAAFLPSNKDFAGPKDPEGKKGMAKWRSEHAPGSGNKRPYWPGEVDKKQF
jgi:hypothetical protein